MEKDKKNEKWSFEQIETLIDAYKEEPCLHATTEAHYHNKHLRREALERIMSKVVKLRSTTITKECSNKFHNLRTQFNIEHAKIRLSDKSGTSTDDIYKPVLWYYQKMLFLNPYVTLRKSRNSIEKEIENHSQCELFQYNIHNSTVIYTDNDEHQVDIAEHYVQEIFAPFEQEVNLQSISPSQTPSISGSISGLCAPRKAKKRTRNDPLEDNYTDDIHVLADSIRQPITVSTTPTSLDPVDTFVAFLGSLLRDIKEEGSRLEIMNKLIQIVIKEKMNDSKNV